MSRLTVLACALAAASITLLPTPATAAPSDLALATRWAPIHYQDTDSSDYDADYLSRVDYDGDWNTLNNWENQSTTASSRPAPTGS
jgi:hypothetical protein